MKQVGICQKGRKIHMAQTNYEQTRDKAQLLFLQHDQSEMIEKFHLKHDEQYLYINFVGREYRIDRSTGKIEWSEDGYSHAVQGNFDETLSIFDLLCCSKEGCHLSGRFSRINNLKGTVYSSGLGNDIFQSSVKYFEEDVDNFARACEQLGGIREKVGDISYRIPVYDFLPVILQLWIGDEEFPSSMQILWDENVMDYMHYETTYYCVSQLLSRLRELMASTPEEKENIRKTGR